VPAGDHTIVFNFAPKAYDKVETVSIIALIGLILLVVVAIVFSFVRPGKKDEKAID
jgi:hypothetical protein